jgi:Ring finger domain
MNIKIPVCYPLRLAEVSSGTGGGRSAGLQESRWRSWLLSVSSVISAQNGTLQDAVILFKKNVQLHFEGIKDCAICYSVIGVIDRQLPTKACRVCKNKFHGSCLYKWFKSSNQNSCPLCRQPF